MRILTFVLTGMLLAAVPAVAVDLESGADSPEPVSLTGAANLTGQASPMTTSRAVIRTDRLSTEPGEGLAGLLQGSGLFDASKLTTWRSYSFEMATGGGYTSSAGLLVQHMHYQFSRPLSLYMEVGLLHDPLGMAGISGANGPQKASIVIPNMDLVYRPTENMVFQLHFSQTTYGNTSPWMLSPTGQTW